MKDAVLNRLVYIVSMVTPLLYVNHSLSYINVRENRRCNLFSYWYC